MPGFAQGGGAANPTKIATGVWGAASRTLTDTPTNTFSQTVSASPASGSSAFNQLVAATTNPTVQLQISITGTLNQGGTAVQPVFSFATGAAGFEVVFANITLTMSSANSAGNISASYDVAIPAGTRVSVKQSGLGNAGVTAVQVDFMM